MPAENNECVRVAVRCRPLSTKEVDEGRQRIVEVNLKDHTIAVKNPKLSGSDPPKTFTFDHVYDWNTIQKNLYDETASPIVDSVIEGYNGTIFAYGQTGTGKTHTMEGKDEPELRGIIPNSFQHVFDAIETSDGKEFLVQASFLEIYNEDVRDLLAKNPNNKLELKETVESGVYVKGLTKFVVKGVAEISNVLKVGKKNRTVGATLMNQDSSRSHSIFTITVETSEHGSGADGHIRMGKLNLVDLAGSERQSKTGATGDRLKEATKINLSLSALGNVISALVDGKSGHIPYRDSKLTRLLQDSLGGNTKTVMVANIGPADYNFDETMSTLRYANRAKNIKNKPRINEDPKDAMLREFQEEIARLKGQLEDGGGGGGGPDEIEEVETVEEVSVSEDKIRQIKIKMKKDMETQMTRGMTEEEVQATMREVEEKASKEMEKLLQDKERTEEEKLRIKEAMDAQHTELEAHNAQLGKERKDRENLEKRVKAMESKLLGGGISIQELTEKQLQEKELLKKQLEDRKKLEEEQQARIQQLEIMAEGADGKYGSMQEEAEIKTRKLKKLFQKYQQVKSETEDMQEEFAREREDMLDSIRTLTRQMKLKDVVIDNFIPGEEVQKIMNRAHWFDEEEVWVLQRLSAQEKMGEIGGGGGGGRGGGGGGGKTQQRPVSAANQKRPVSDYARMVNAMGDLNPRFKSENILSLELDMPERTTYDYDMGARNNPRVQAALDAAFSEDSEMIFVDPQGSEKLRNVAMMEERGASRAGGRPQSATRRRPGTASRRASGKAA